MAPPSGGRGRGGRATGGGRGRGRSKASAPSGGIPIQQQQVQLVPVIQEEVWAQCDACQKWRRLLPGTVVDEDAPWFCNLNPDKDKASCSIPEENYDAEKEVVIASSDPFYSNLVPKDPEALKKELLAKAGYLPEPVLPAYGSAGKLKKEGGYQLSQQSAKVPVKQQKQQKKDALDKVATKGAQALQDAKNLAQACHKIIANAGSWEEVGPSGQVTASSPPNWVWQGLAKLVPEAVQEAVFAFDALSATRCMCTQAQMPSSSPQVKLEPQPSGAAPRAGSVPPGSADGGGPSAMQVDSPQPGVAGPGGAADTAPGAGGSGAPAATPAEAMRQSSGGAGPAAAAAATSEAVSQLQVLAQLAMLTVASVALPKAKQQEDMLAQQQQAAAMAAAAALGASRQFGGGPSNQYKQGLSQPHLLQLHAHAAAAQQATMGQQGLPFSPAGGAGMSAGNGELAGSAAGMAGGLAHANSGGWAQGGGWSQPGRQAATPGVSPGAGILAQASWQQLPGGGLPSGRQSSGGGSGSGSGLQGLSQQQQHVNLQQQALARQPSLPLSPTYPQQLQQQQQQLQQALAAQQLLQQQSQQQQAQQQLQQHMARIASGGMASGGMQQQQQQSPMMNLPPALLQQVVQLHGHNPAAAQALMQQLQTASYQQQAQAGQQAAAGYQQQAQAGQQAAAGYQQQAQAGQQAAAGYQQQAQAGQQAAAGYQQQAQQTQQAAGYQQQGMPGQPATGYQQQAQQGQQAGGYQPQAQQGQQWPQQQAQQGMQASGYQQQPQQGTQAAGGYGGYQQQAQPGVQAAGGYEQQQAQAAARYQGQQGPQERMPGGDVQAAHAMGAGGPMHPGQPGGQAMMRQPIPPTQPGPDVPPAGSNQTPPSAWQHQQ